jgi:choice-of-anchor C domain-containing protein
MPAMRGLSLYMAQCEASAANDCHKNILISKYTFKFTVFKRFDVILASLRRASGAFTHQQKVNNMISNTFLKLALVSAMLSAGYAQASTELVVNGNFESFTGASFTGYKTVGNGQTTITGWDVSDTSVDLINNGQYGAISGTSIDMLGTPGPGAISQTLNTVAGQSYTLSFDLSKNPGDSPALFVSLNGGSATEYLGSSTITPYTMNFTATSNATVLKFESAASGYSGAVIDNVSVLAAVPEPETYGMLLAGLGLIGFMARRRKA